MTDLLAPTIAHVAALFMPLDEAARIARDWPTIRQDIEHPTEPLLHFIGDRLRSHARDVRNAGAVLDDAEAALLLSAAFRADGLGMAFDWLASAVRAANLRPNALLPANRFANHARELFDAALAGDALPYP